MASSAAEKGKRPSQGLVRLFAAAFSYGVVLTEYEYVQLLDAFDVLRFWPARSCLYFMLGLLTFEPKKVSVRRRGSRSVPTQYPYRSPHPSLPPPKHVWLYWPQTAVACGLMVLALLYGALAVHVEVGGEFVAWLLRAQNLVRRPSRPLSGLG